MSTSESGSAPPIVQPLAAECNAERRFATYSVSADDADVDSLVYD